MYAAQSLLAPESQKIDPRDLVLIGGGSTASTFILRLVQELKQNPQIPRGFNIYCFDQNGFSNGGIAYGSCSKHHILNSVRSEMSPWDVDAFHNYCIQHNKGTCRDSFNARQDYRDFLSLQTIGAVRYLKELGIKFIQSPKDVGVVKRQDSYAVTDINAGHSILHGCNAGQIVLATGYGPNRNFETWRSGVGSDRYAHSLYGAGRDGIFAERASSLKPSPHIVFIGSGPALYDCVNDLYGAGITTARLTVISGTGPLAVRDLSIEQGEKNIRPQNLLSVAGSAKADDLVHAIGADFLNAASKRRVALDILKNIGVVLKSMEEGEAQRFQSSAIIGHLRHAATPVPKESHARLAALSPSFIGGRLCEEDLKIDSRGRITIRRGDLAVINVDLIVNGTGHGRHNAPIFDGMKKDGSAKISTALGVLETLDDGYRLAGSGIACIGPATHVGCDGVESFDVPAQNCAKDIVLRL